MGEVYLTLSAQEKLPFALVASLWIAVPEL